MKKLLTLLFLLFSFSTWSLTIKMAVVAPEGTSWSKHLKKMSKEIKKKTDGAVKIKIYYGGSQGDEPDVLRKVRVGQLHGGLFTGKTLGDISGDVRVIEVPFTFNGNREKGWNTLNKMTPYFNSKFNKSGFMNLGFFELGMIYYVSQKKSSNLEDLKGTKIWSWEGDRLVSTMIDVMKLVSVPLPLPDVLSSLSTGIVEAAYAPPVGIIALQWNTKIKYLVDFPIAYSIGAFMVSNKQWGKIKPAHQKIVKDLADEYIAKINKDLIVENKDALAALKASGVEFVSFPEKEAKRSSQIRSEILAKMKGNLISTEAIKSIQKEL